MLGYKNKYELQLDNWLEEYGLTYKEQSDSTEIHNILMDLFKTRCDGKRVALWGAGRKNTENSHAAIILKKYTTYIQGMCCVIDSMEELWGDEFMGYPIIAPKDIQKNQVDIVIIASKVQADSIVKDLHSYAPDCEYIDIYGELKARGMEIYHKFYEESNIYTSLYRIRKEYEGETDFHKKGRILRRLISAYLSINDFYYARYFGQRYVEIGYADYNSIQEFFGLLDGMEKEIQDINSRKKDDVVIFFVDSLRAMDVFHRDDSGCYQGDMLRKYLDNATVFVNAKSTGVTTYESMISVIKKKYPYEQNVYENNILAEFDEFELLPVAKEQGYSIKFYISEGYQIIHDTPEVDFIKQVYLPAKLWKLNTDMACATEKTFNFIYVPYELHFPLICGYHEKEPKVSGFVDVGIKDTKDYVPRQLEECKSYVDKQFDYYESYFGKDILFTMFSDHSQVVFDELEKKPYFMYHNNQDRCVNVTFFIKGAGIEHQWNDKLVSLYDFCDIHKALMEGRGLYVPERDIAIYQYYKIHYKKLREYAQEHNMQDYIDGMQCFTSKEYMYVVTATGKEAVYELKGVDENAVCSSDGNNFIKRVKDKYKVVFPKFITD